MNIVNFIQLTIEASKLGFRYYKFFSQQMIVFVLIMKKLNMSQCHKQSQIKKDRILMGQNVYLTTIHIKLLYLYFNNEKIVTANRKKKHFVHDSRNFFKVIKALKVIKCYT